MCVLDARMGLVLYRWKVNNESGVSHAETVPGMPHMLLTAAERTLTGTHKCDTNALSYCVWRSS
jgi:hypothetical protein